MHDAPGQNYLYSNVGMALLATILCSVSEEIMSSCCRKNICDPLHMDHTTTNRDLISSDLVQGYNWKENQQRTGIWMPWQVPVQYFQPSAILQSMQVGHDCPSSVTN